MALEDRIIDPILTTHAKGYKNTTMVADTMAPVVFTNLYGGRVIRYGQERFMPVDDRRRPGGNTIRIDGPTYSAERFAIDYRRIETKVPRETLRDQQNGPGINAQRNAVTNGMSRMLITRELEVAATVRNATMYPVGNVVALAATDQFNAATSNPLRVFAAGRARIRELSGVEPNKAHIPYVVMEFLRIHPTIKAAFSSTSDRSLTNEDIRKYLLLDEIIVCGGLYIDPLTGTKMDIWGKDIVLSYSASPSGSVDIESAEPTFAYTYAIEGHPFVEPVYFEQNPASWFTPITFDRVVVICFNEAGYLIQNAVA